MGLFVDLASTSLEASWTAASVTMSGPQPFQSTRGVSHPVEVAVELVVLGLVRDFGVVAPILEGGRGR